MGKRYLAAAAVLASTVSLGCGDDNSSSGASATDGGPDRGGSSSRGGNSSRDAGGVDPDGGSEDEPTTTDGTDAVGSDATPAVESPQVALEQGEVRGARSDGVHAFLGIPFGAPTGGDNRWTAPQPASGWDGVLEATEFGAPCAQLDPTGSSFDTSSSEDCLTINVWGPDEPAAEPLPVMVWIYGGAYQFGSGAEPYNGEALVKAGEVIVVTFNYRLAAMGFFAHPAITEAARDAGSPPSNFGLQDQQLALRWVQENIAAFGGDPDNVTLFGESAGANSICMHLLAEGSQDLFRRAIVESGLCLKPMLTLADAEAKGERFAQAMGCDDPDEVLSCLRALDMETVLAGPDTAPEEIPGGLFYQDATVQFGFQPFVDGDFIAEQPSEAFAAGRFGEVEQVLHGATTDEGALFHAPPLGGTQPMGDAEYEAALQNRFGDQASDVAAEYPPGDYPTHADALSEVAGDAIFRCPAIRMAELLHAAGKTNYLYRFDLPITSSFEALSGRAFHSADIPYVFGNEYILGSVPPEHEDAVGAVQGYWTRFAANGDPNGGSAVEWPVFDDSAEHLNLQDPITTGSDWSAEGCEFWDTIEIVPF